MTPHGVLALVRLLARDAAREALADHAYHLGAREIAVGARTGAVKCPRPQIVAAGLA